MGTRYHSTDVARTILVFMWLLVGCGNSDSPRNNQAVLDTSPRRKETSFKIQRWNLSTRTWFYTADQVNTTLEWRFISSRDTASGILVSGGYTITWNNPTAEKVDVQVDRLLFQDRSGIPVAEFTVGDTFVINPNSGAKQFKTFNIALASLAVSNEVANLSLTGMVGYQP